MAPLAGAMCGVRNDSCSRKHKYARTSREMASESLLRGVDPFFAQEFCFFKQEHGPPKGSKQAKTDVLLTTVLGPLRRARTAPAPCPPPPPRVAPGDRAQRLPGFNAPKMTRGAPSRGGRSHPPARAPAAPPAVRRCAPRRSDSPFPGRRATLAGCRRCGCSSGTPFPAARPPRHGNVAVCAPVRARGCGAGRRAWCRCATERATALKARVQSLLGSAAGVQIL